MLKRQRALSPPPSAPAVPLVSETPESQCRESKRRRILPPSLDGQSRRPTFLTEDDGEEDDDEDDIDHAGQRIPPAAAPSGATAYNTEYESANTFLHDLHALHRHRLIFASPPSSPGLLSPPHSQDKSHLPQITDYSQMLDKQDLSGVHDFGHGLSVQEVESVKERYEDTNRLLGSLFLTRRKQLDPGPSQYNT